MKPFFAANGVEIYHGDSRELLRQLPDESVHCCVTSPPYWGLRDYGVGGQIGLESTPYEYITTMRMLFAEVRRVLRSDGTLWLNMGDSYSGSGPSGASYQSKTTLEREGKRKDGNFAISKTLGARGLTYADKKPIPPPGLKPKDLCGIPWMLAFALREDGWYLRQDIIWAKPNPMPESVTDRCTKSHEYIFLLSKSERYYYNSAAIAEPVSWPLDLDRESPPKFGGNKAEGYGTRVHSGKEYKRKSWNGSSFDNGKTGEMKHTRGGRRPKAWDNDMGSNRTLVAGYGRKEYTPDQAGGGKGIAGHSGGWKPDGSPLYGDTRNKRSVWQICTQSFPEAHFATFPEDLIKPCILAGTPPFVCSKCLAPVVHSSNDNTEQDSIQEEVRRVREEVRRPQSEILQSLMFDEGSRSSQEAKAETVQAVRQDVQSSERESLLTEVHSTVANGAGTEGEANMDREASAELEGRKGSHRRIHQGLRSEHQEIPNGTSSRDGEDTGTTTHALRVCSPQERDQDRQFANQSGADGGEPTSGNGYLPSLPEAIQPSLSSCCNAPLTTGTVLDPFGGAGTTGLVARKLHCKAILLELNPEYIEISAKRLSQAVFHFGENHAETC